MVISIYILMNRQSPNAGLLQPNSMEDRARYLARFETNAVMRDIFDDKTQRLQVAAEIFWTRWEDASATVTKEDGTQFFID